MTRWLSSVAGLAKDACARGWKNHKWYILGWIATWLFPLAFLSVYLGLETSKKPKISFAPWVLLCLLVLLIVYYKKIKGTVKKKMFKADLNGVPVSPLWYLVNGSASVIAIAACYWVVNLLNQFNLDNLLTYLLFCMSSIGFGALCYAIDATNNLIRIKDLKDKEKKEVISS